MPKMFYQGHASFRITNDRGKTLFIDPYAGVGYQTPADLVLITHEHYDHNDVSKLTISDRTIFIRAKDSILADGGYASFEYHGFRIRAVPAYNSHHDKNECVGFLIEVDGKRIYHAGDTGLIQEMSDLAALSIDYALLPIDGYYTMTPEDAAKAGEIIKPKRLIPMHMSSSLDFDMAQAMKVHSDRAILMRVNESLEL